MEDILLYLIQKGHSNITCSSENEVERFPHCLPSGNSWLKLKCLNGSLRLCYGMSDAKTEDLIPVTMRAYRGALHCGILATMFLFRSCLYTSYALDLP